MDASVTGANSQNSSNCFWLNHSETCTKIKIACSVVLQIAAITVLALGILSLLSQMGFNIPAGINPIANTLHAQHLYVLVGVSSGILIIDTVVLIALVRNYLNRTFSDRELKKLGIEKEISDQCIADKMPNKSYWEVDKPLVKADGTNRGSPAVFALTVKDSQGIVFTKGFKKHEERTAFITHLAQASYTNGKLDFAQSAVYDESYLSSRYGLAFDAIKQKPDGVVPERHFVYREETLPGTNEKVVVLTARNNDKIEQHFLKEGKLQEFCTQKYLKFIDYQRAREAVKVAFVKNVPPLVDNEYWTFEATLNEVTLYALAYKPQGSATSENYYINIQERAQELQRLSSDHWVDAKAEFEKSSTYKPSHLQFLGTQVPEGLSNAIVRENAYFLAELTTPNNPIYALKLSNNVLLYFKTSEARKAYIIENNLQDAFDISDIEQQLFGGGGKLGIIDSEDVKLYCTAEKEYWPCHTQTNGKPIFAILINKGKQVNWYNWWCDATNENSEIFQKGQDYGPDKGYVNAKRRADSTTEYTLAQAKSLVAPEALKKLNKVRLLNKQYVAWDLPRVNGKGCVYALKVYGKPSVTYFFKTSEARSAFAKKGGHYNIRTLKDRIYKDDGLSIQKRIDKYPLNYFFKANWKIDDIDIYVIAFLKEVKGKQIVKHKAYFSEDERSEDLKRTPQFIEAESIFDAPYQYKNKVAEEWISPKHLEVVNDPQNKNFSGANPSEYVTYNIPKEKDSSTTIYALVYKDKQPQPGQPTSNKSIYFSTHQARESFISAELKDYTDTMGLYFALYGVPTGMKGSIGAYYYYHIAKFLTYPGEAFHNVVPLHGKGCFFWFQVEADGNITWHTCDDVRNGMTTMQAAINKIENATFVDRTQYLTFFNCEALESTIQALTTNNFIDSILEDNQYWLEENVSIGNKKCDILFYINSEHVLSTKVFAPAQGTRFINDRNFVNGKEAFNKSVFFPQSLGEFLVRASTNQKLDDIQERREKLNNGEYSILDPTTYPDGVQHSPVHVLILKDKDGNQQTHYLKNLEKVKEISQGLSEAIFV